MRRVEVKFKLDSSIKFTSILSTESGIITSSKQSTLARSRLLGPLKKNKNTRVHTCTILASSIQPSRLGEINTI